MDKLQKNSGFTMIEMILTLFIVSIILLSTITVIPKYNYGNIDEEIQNIEYLFQNAQFRAKSFESSQHIMLNHYSNEIVIKDYKNNYEKEYQLKQCRIVQGGLEDVFYYPNGNTSKFGTITFDCHTRVIKIVFQIQKGRYHIEG